MSYLAESHAVTQTSHHGPPTGTVVNGQNITAMWTRLYDEKGLAM